MMITQADASYKYLLRYPDKFGFKTIYEAMINSGNRDAKAIRTFFSDLTHQKEKAFFEIYLNFGSDVFGFYASTIAGIISSIGFEVSYYPLLGCWHGMPVAGTLNYCPSGHIQEYCIGHKAGYSDESYLLNDY